MGKLSDALEKRKKETTIKADPIPVNRIDSGVKKETPSSPPMDRITSAPRVKAWRVSSTAWPGKAVKLSSAGLNSGLDRKAATSWLRRFRPVPTFPLALTMPAMRSPVVMITVVFPVRLHWRKVIRFHTTGMLFYHNRLAQGSGREAYILTSR